MLEELKEKVLNANQSLVKYGLVTLTWGNVSGIDWERNLIVIKPSGVEYGKMTPDNMVVVNMDGKTVEGKLIPSSDTPTHIELYKAFSESHLENDICGIAHSHSAYATIFAQAGIEIPCFGTTHADHFNGAIPVTRFLTKEEVKEGYELNTGKIIVECFNNHNPVAMPGVLVRGHAPFTWGKSPEESVKNSLALERIAKMALHSLELNPALKGLPDYIIKKHFNRKHGEDAYYGQQK